MTDFILSGIRPDMVSDVAGALLLSGEIDCLMLSIPSGLKS